MAGLWERVRPDANDRVNVHLIVASIKAYYVQTEDATKGATRLQIRNHLDAHLQTPLSGAEITDLEGIADTIDGLPNANAKQSFVFLCEYAFIAAETGDINETKWRSDLGI